MGRDLGKPEYAYHKMDLAPAEAIIHSQTLKTVQKKHAKIAAGKIVKFDLSPLTVKVDDSTRKQSSADEIRFSFLEILS